MSAAVAWLGEQVGDRPGEASHHRRRAADSACLRLLADAHPADPRCGTVAGVLDATGTIRLVVGVWARGAVR